MQSLLPCFSLLAVTSLWVLAEVTTPLRVGIFDVRSTDLVCALFEDTEIGGGRTDVIEILGSSSISISFKVPLLPPNVVCKTAVSQSTLLPFT